MTKLSGIYAPDGSMYATLTDGQGNLVSSNYLPTTFDMIGDSRTSQVTSSGGFALTGQHWFNQANALAGHRYILGLNQGISGNRTDQYLVQSNLAPCLSSKAGWLIFGMPMVNDIAQATSTPYTNVNGVSVTISNVTQVGMSNIIAAASQALALGKKVILTLEPGASTLSTAQVGAVHDFNDRLTAYANATPGVYLWSANGVLWNQTGSATVIAFNTNYSSDGTHYTFLGGYFAGKAFNTFFQNLIPVADLAIASINDVNAVNPRQLCANPLFTTLTGGTATSIVITSGTVPSGWTITAPATVSATITSASDPKGFGNDVTFALTSSASGLGKLLLNAPSTGLWSLSDVIQGGIDCSVAAASSNAGVYFECANATSTNNSQQYDLLPPTTTIPGPTEAYSYRFQSLAVQGSVLGGTQNFLNPINVFFWFTAAGSITFTVSRAWASRVLQYNSTTGVFTG